MSSGSGAGSGDGLRIAIAGTRGVPASYGGFETFAEELGAGLAERGHDVTVYCRAHFARRGLRRYRGVRLRVLPTVRHKYFETVAHTALSVLDSLRRRYDVVLVCNSANAPFALVPRLTGARVVLNVDGLEWKRDKWAWPGRAYYRFCAWLSARLPIVLVSDARVVAEYYRDRHSARSVYIGYGSRPERRAAGETVERLGLTPGRYILFVSRLEPENNAHLVVEGYARAGGLERLGMPLVLVGDAPYATAYKAALARQVSRTPGAVLTGYIFGEGYAELQSNCAIYVQATEVGGTHPALLEAMGRGACVLAHDVPEHREVLATAGAYYERGSADSLAARLGALVADAAARAALGEAARSRAEALYSWESVTTAYERLFRRLAGRPG